MIPELTTRRVLTSELIEGVPLDRCSALDQESKNKVCLLILAGRWQQSVCVYVYLCVKLKPLFLCLHFSLGLIGNTVCMNETNPTMKVLFFTITKKSIFVKLMFSIRKHKDHAL